LGLIRYRVLLIIRAAMKIEDEKEQVLKAVYDFVDERRYLTHESESDK
jgi:hypothetical protein